MSVGDATIRSSCAIHTNSHPPVYPNVFLLLSVTFTNHAQNHEPDGRWALLLSRLVCIATHVQL